MFRRGKKFSRQKPGEHAGIAVGKISEIVVRAHFSAVKGIFFAHGFFDKSMSGFAGKARVMDNFFMGICFKERTCEHAHNIIALNKASVGIIEEAAVKITVPGNAEIRLVFAHKFCCFFSVFRQKRIRNTVGECAVRCFVHKNKFKRQMRDKFFECKIGTAVSGRSHNFKGRESFCINIGKKFFNIFGTVGTLNKRTCQISRDLLSLDNAFFDCQ